ncbi:MAG: NifU family protein [Acholeplasmataceae bacterium]
MKMDETEKMVRELIEKVRPYIQNDGGDIEIVSVDEGLVYVKMLGACDGCPLIDITLREGIETMLLENVPGVIGVVLV